jgi:F-type H+-transporting ATPase subunit delta
MIDCELKIEKPIVNRYVKALYEVAVSLKIEKQISDELRVLKDCVLIIDEYEKYLKKFSLMAEYAKKFIIVLKEELDLSKQTENFLMLLMKNNRLSLLVEICNEYLSFVDKKQGKKVFFVTYAADFSKTDEQRLINKLSTVFDGNIECVSKKDPSLIGGMKIQFRSKILDYSVKSELARLHRTIKGDVYEN